MQPFFFPTKVRQYRDVPAVVYFSVRKICSASIALHCIDIEEGKPLHDFIVENTRTDTGNKGLGAWLTLLAGGFVIILLVGVISLLD